jgi:hypothetical protein
MLRICLSGRPKRRKQPERYAQYGLTLIGNYAKRLRRQLK